MRTQAVRTKWTTVSGYLRKGAWSVLDQALFAGSNFLLNVLLARWLLPPDYGAFTVAYATFLLLGTYHTATLIEPMLVFGSGKYRARLSDYFGILLQGHLGFTLIGSLLLALIGLYFWHAASAELSSAFFGLALAQPFILFLWLVRQACYARLNPRLATSAGGIYLLCMLAGLALLYSQGWLSILTALCTMAAASLLAGLWITARLGVGPALGVDSAFRASVAREHWKYGRWSASTSLLTWIPGNIYFLVLPLWGGLEATAVLRALQNLVLPLLNFHSAIAAILLPSLVRAKEEGSFGRWIRLSLLFFSIISLLYWMLLGLFYAPVLDWLYQGQYAEYGHLLWLIGLSPLLYGLNQVFGGALRALERPDRIFWAYVVSTVVVLTVGLACIALWTVLGAVIANLVSSLATVVMLVLLLKSVRSLPAQQELE